MVSCSLFSQYRWKLNFMLCVHIFFCTFLFTILCNRSSGIQLSLFFFYLLLRTVFFFVFWKTTIATKTNYVFFFLLCYFFFSLKINVEDILISYNVPRVWSNKRFERKFTRDSKNLFKYDVDDDSKDSFTFSYFRFNVFLIKIPNVFSLFKTCLCFL